MLKYIGSMLAICCAMIFVLWAAFADSPGMSPKGTATLSVNANTGGAATVTSTTEKGMYGYLDGIYLDIAGTAGATVNVSIATSTGGNIAVARTLYANTAYSNAHDGYLPLRQQAKDNTGAAISGVWCPYSLFGETVTLSVTNASTTGVTFRAVLVTAP